MILIIIDILLQSELHQIILITRMFLIIQGQLHLIKIDLVLEITIIIIGLIIFKEMIILILLIEVLINIM